ncbi:MAG: hypothetical protein ACRCX8_12725 [Sarcina sp.]
MYCNIKKLKEEGSEVKIGITEFYPLVDDLVIVPASRINGLPYYAFGDCCPDGLSIGSVDEDDLLSFEKYKKALDKFVKEVNEDSEEDIELSFDVEQLYNRYLVASSVFTIAGVVSVVNVENDTDISVSSDQLMVTPADGVELLLDIESYWKAVMFVVPNLLMDASTAVRMYEVYKASSDFGKKDKVYPSILLLKSESLSELVDSVKEALDDTDLNSKEIRGLITEEEVKSSQDMTPYYKEMLSNHDVGQALAAGYIPYCYASHYKKVYEAAGIEDLYDTNTVLMVKLSTKEKKDKKKARGIF